MKKVKFMCTAFRDGFQSVYGARVFTKDFLPAVEAAKAAGINHFEAGGGARFQSLYFYTNEDAFKMMDDFRRVAGPDADLQTLSRGINVVGLDSQPRDIIKMHADLFKKHGISTIRNFDALNDVNNLIDSGRAIHEAGARHEVCVTMMALPPGATGAHDPEFYESTLRNILDAGIPYDSVCFKDASGTSTPKIVHETIKRARKLLGKDMNIVFHSHETAGVCIQQYVSALEAGADQVDLSMVPVSGGTCQPDVITMWHALRGTDFTLDVDIDKVMEAERVFQDCMSDYFLPPEATQVNPIIPFSPLPGGALTANTQMLRDNGLMDRFAEITHAMADVVAKGGYATSVTPVSQFYFQQAFNNVMFGPWKKIAEGYGKMVLGYFGRTPVEPDETVVKISSEQLKLEPTKEIAVDINDKDPKKGRDAAIAMLKAENIEITEENIFIAASCKEKGILFLSGNAKVNGVRLKSAEKKAEPAAPAPAKSGSNAYTVKVNNNIYAVELKDNQAVVNGVAYPLDIQEGIAAPSTNASAPAASTGADVPVKAPMPGLILRSNVSVGDKVKENDVLMVMEAMKMENEIFAPVSGTVKEIKVKQGDQLNADEILLVIGSEGAPAAAAPSAPAPAASATPAPSSGAETEVKAPMPGLVLRIDVKEGDQVQQNGLLLVMEAMKMENEIFAPISGTVKKILVKQGDQLKADDVLAVIG
ncbi:biotin/lipoyl-containing protein [Pleomorphochaeta sp. DL1XJH-081]|uniref:biotin/lipoyl-containing protein n=1 Tax=Pleomorphochaeta sp. DL1XJH-081 TaxID=3409690 RepID=UPI003BB736E9